MQCIARCDLRPLALKLGGNLSRILHGRSRGSGEFGGVGTLGFGIGGSIGVLRFGHIFSFDFRIKYSYKFAAAGRVDDKVDAVDFDDFFDGVVGAKEGQVGAETDMVVLLGRDKDRCKAGKQVRARTEGLELGADTLRVFIKAGIDEDASDIADGTLGEGVVQEAVDAVPQREGALQDGGREVPTVPETGGDGQNFVFTGGGRGGIGQGERQTDRVRHGVGWKAKRNRTYIL